MALITSQTFFFPPWLWRHKKQPKYHKKLFVVHSVFMDQSCHTQVFLNISVRDGNFILACRLASDSPVSPGCDECLVVPASNIRMFLIFEKQGWISHKMLLALFPWGSLSGVWYCQCSNENTFCGKVFLWGGSHRWAPAGAEWVQGLCANLIPLTRVLETILWTWNWKLSWDKLNFRDKLVN